MHILCCKYYYNSIRYHSICAGNALRDILTQTCEHSSNRVGAEEITTGILYIRLFSHKVQSDSTTIKQSSLICRNTTVSAFHPSVTNNIYGRAVPAPNYLPEWRSAVFQNHYSPDRDGGCDKRQRGRNNDRCSNQICTHLGRSSRLPCSLCSSLSLNFFLFLSLHRQFY